MTSTSTFPIVKAHLIALLKAAEALAGVEVSYGDPGGTLEREHVFLGGTGQDGQTWGPLGARQRDEVYGIEFVVHVKTPGATQQEATERAHVLFGAMESVVRPLPDSTLAAAHVWYLDVVPNDVIEFKTDEGHACLIGGELVVQARI